MPDASAPARTGAALAAGLLAWHWLPWWPALLVALLMLFTLTALKCGCEPHTERPTPTA